MQAQNSLVNPEIQFHTEEAITEEEKMKLLLQMQEMKATLQLIDMLMGKDEFNVMMNASEQKPPSPKKPDGTLWNPFEHDAFGKDPQKLLKEFKKRRTKMNKHKLKKRRRKNRFKKRGQ